MKKITLYVNCIKIINKEDEKIVNSNLKEIS